MGRVDPFDDPPFANLLASPLGLVAKHEPGKFRLIHDLSFPRDDSINTYTSKEFTTVHYETLYSVVDLVKLYGPGSLPVMTLSIRTLPGNLQLCITKH